MGPVTVHPDLRAAIRERLLSPDLFDLPQAVDWEGRAFQPVLKTPWLRERLFPLASRPRGLGRGGAISHAVNFVATLFYPSGQGATEIEAAAARLLGVFAPGVHLVRGATTGTVQSAERAAVRQEPDWQSLPVTINILAYTAG